MHKRFRVRGPDRRNEAELSKDEIIEAIRSGRFSGEEQIAALDGDLGWSKLAAHPSFYDEFLRRIFHDAYQVSNFKEPEASPKGQTEPKPAADTSVGKDRRPTEKQGLPGPMGSELSNRGHTIHESEIEDLFSKSVTTPKGPFPEPQLEQSDDVLLGAEEVTAPSRPRSKRLIRLALLAAAPLLMMFYFGKPPQKGSGANGLDLQTPTDLAGVEVEEDFTGSQSREAALIAEADEYYRLDLPVFLEAAELKLRQVAEIADRRADVFGRLALVLSREFHFATGSKNGMGMKGPEIKRRLMEVIERGRSREPQLSVFYVAEGEIALDEMNLTQASRAAEFAIQTGAGDFLGQYLKARIGVASGTVSSLPDLGIIPSSHRIQTSVLSAKLLFKRGEIKRAREMLLGALEENPLHIPSYLLLGEVFSGQNELNEARNAFETAARLSPLDFGTTAAGAFVRLGEVLLTLGMTPEAMRSYQFALANGASPETLQRASPKPVVLDDAVREAARKESYDSSYFLGQGKVLMSEKNFPGAALFFRAAERLQRKDPNILLNLGRALESMATTSMQAMRAGENYREALRFDPSNVEVLLQLGEMETNLYEFGKAQNRLDRAAQLRPTALEPLVALGKHFFKRQDYQKSLEKFLAARQRAPLNPEVSFYAGLLISKFSKEQMRDALNLFYKAYTLDPQNIEALIEWLRLKVVYYEKNFAIKFASSLIQQDPKNSNYRWAMGEVYRANNEFHRAIRYFHEALDLDNRNAKVRMALGSALMALGEAEAAAEEFRLSSRLDYKNGEGYFLAGEANLGLKNLVAAERDISALLKALPKYPGAHRLMSKLSYLRGRREEAVSEMRIEVSNNPFNTLFRQELAELLFEYRKYDEALVELSAITTLPNRAKAPEFTGQKVRAFLWLSRTHRARGQFESAEGAIRLAIELSPNDPDLIREQGFVFQGERRNKEAAVAFENYLKRNPTAVDAEEIKKLIESLVIEE